MLVFGGLRPARYASGLVTVGNHPVVVCGELSSAGLFWPARLLSSRLGRGGLSADGGMGKVAGGSWAVVVSSVCPMRCWVCWI